MSATFYKKIFRVQTVTRFQNILMQNTFHVGTEDVLLLGEDLADDFYREVCMQIMTLQVFNVVYERLYVTCLNPEFPQFVDWDLDNRRPPLDVVALPNPICHKWTTRNVSTSRNQIGGFYLGGLISSHWNHNAYTSDEGNQSMQHVKGVLMSRVGVGGSRNWTLGTYSRTLRSKFPSLSVQECFFGMSSLNYNRYYTSHRKRSPGVGQ